MKYDFQEVRRRMDELNRILEQTQTNYESYDGRALRISCQYGFPRFYLKQKNDKTDGVYLKKDDLETAKQVAQSCYDKDIYKLAQKELQYLEQFIAHYPEKTVEDVYPGLHPARKQLVLPTELPEDEYVQQWLAVEWENNTFREEDHSEYYNKLGVRMHSKEETLISNTLIDRGRPQRYEFPIFLKGIGKVHPDFTILNPRTRKVYYWEHLGFWDDMTYRKIAIQRLVAYQRTGIFPGEQLILTFESSNYHPGFYDINALIDRYLV